MAAVSPNRVTQPIVIPPPTAEEEGISQFGSVANRREALIRLSIDQIILARIALDERPLRRIIKKFHTYSSLSHTPIVPLLGGPTSPSTVEDAREAFLIELASFQLLMKKAAMTCEAEVRQVEEYHCERRRLGMFKLCATDS